MIIPFRSSRCHFLVMLWQVVLFTFLAGTLDAAELRESVRRQIGALHAEKAARTPVQRKLDSQLIYATKSSRKEAIAPGVMMMKADVVVEADQRVLVDIQATVTPPLLNEILRLRGKVFSSFPKFRTLRALVPLAALDALAAREDVRFIQPAVKAFTRDTCCGGDGGAFVIADGDGDPGIQTGTVVSQGDITHRAAEARANFGVNGSGVKVGVISDSVDFLAGSQATGNLPAVTVLETVQGSGEGTAMLEIVHDLAPGAQLFFATAFISPAGFAQNIRNLRAAGCDIIVDDVGYFNESPFQDGPIAQAVNEVTRDGALYFSSAANSGNKNDNTSGTWEGDFVDGGTATFAGRGGQVHDFGGTTLNTVAEGGGSRRVDLFWADPLGGSTNDYDVYVLDAAGTTVLRSSTNSQTGTQDPYESLSTLNVGEKIAIVRFSGAPRYLHLGTGRGVLTLSTPGETHGHSAAADAYSVAATWVRDPAKPFVGGAANPVETFSSDGQRRIFFQPDGTPITPGNFTATGGIVRQKPDITAADGVATSVPGFGTFFGTSAAAPHAAAIAALLKSYNPSLTPAQIRQLLTSTALDIEAPGLDRDSGHGIVMAQQVLAAAPVPVAQLVLGTVALSGGNGNDTIEPNECATLQIALRNVIGSQAAMGVTARLTTTTPGVFITQRTATFPDISVGATAASMAPFQISTVPEFVCGTNVKLVLTVETANAGGFVFPLMLMSGTVGTALDFASTDVPKPIEDESTNDSTVTVTGIERIGKVTVALHLTHTYDSDLTLQLVGPDGTTVNLAVERGDDGDNFGSSCEARTVFDDAAAHPISFGPVPFVGTFRPDEPLNLFRGKSGAAANGTWTLRVIDSFAVDVGTISCWTLSIAPLICTDGGGLCPSPGFLRFSDTGVNGREPALAITASVERVAGAVGTVSVDVATTTDGSATSGVDYLPVVSTLTWADGETGAKPITVRLANDTIDEPNETLRLVLSNPTGGAQLARPESATLTIVDNDGLLLITHSFSQEIISGSSVACLNDAGFNNENSYWRAFDLPSFGVAGPFTVTSVDVGIEATIGGTQPFTTRLHRNSGERFPAGTLDELAATTVQVTDQFEKLLNLPITTVVPAGAELIMQCTTPAAGTNSTVFFLGANGAGESAPSYLGAPECDLPTPTSLAEVGFPQTHWVMNVRGTDADLELVEAASVKTHGGTTYALPLALFGPAGVEPRSGGSSGTHTLVFQFNRPLVTGTVSVSGGVGTISGPPIFKGNQVQVNLLGVANRQNLVVTLANLTADNGAALNSVSVPVSFLFGDVNQSRTVNVSDINLIRAGASPGAVNAGNFQRDLNVSGAINITDVNLSRAASGTTLP